PTLSFAVLRYTNPLGRHRRALADKLTFEYGLLGSYRWQDQDVVGGETVPRGLRATAFDVWARLDGPTFRIELEAAVLYAYVAQASQIPGVLMRVPFTALQHGAALETDFG